jgi:C4-dicarboxylate-specific signal transduction histidine kinase
MTLEHLSLQYNCLCAIGNSLDIKELASEVIHTYTKNSHAICGRFFTKNHKNEIFNELACAGKSRKFHNIINLDELDSDDMTNECQIIDYDDEHDILVLHLYRSKIVMVYKKRIHDIEFLSAMFGRLNEKLNNSILACMSVEELTIKQKELETKSYKLIMATHKLKKKTKIISQQSRMSAMGETLFMLAHQWRQPLSQVQNDIISLSIDNELGELDEKYISSFASSTETKIKSMSDTIDKFISFFSNHQEETSEAYIYELIEEPLKLISLNFTDIDIDFHIDYHKCKKRKIKIDKSKLNQVLLSIYKNAIEELRDINSQNAKIVIDVEVVGNKESELHINIKNNGNLLKTKDTNTIFEPYFSTKSKNGTGLGLFFTKILLEEHLNGSISAYNQKSRKIKEDDFVVFDIKIKLD